MNTKENGKLILEYMDLKPHEISKDLYGLSISPWVAVSGITPESVIEQISSSLRYHSSWSWLMPVVEKIESETGWELVMYSNECYWNKWGNQLFETTFTGQRIEAIYKAVAAFITQYNTESTYVITAKSIVPFKDHDHDDQVEMELITQEYEVITWHKEEALDMFHNNIPIACLENFEINCYKKSTDE